jgi:trk system potassium uptake protein TrkA
MFILIAGGGKLGSNLATMLREADHEVTVVEQNAERAAQVAEQHPDVHVVHGDACEPVILEAAHVSRADAVAAVTGDDEDNLVVCLLGRREYGVDLSIARVNDPRNEWLFDARFGVDIAISNTRMIARLLNEEIGLGHLVTVLSMLKEGLDLVQLTVAPGAPAVDAPLEGLGLPPEAKLIALLRDGSVIIPRGTTVLESGDEVLAIAERASIDALKHQLLGKTT